MSGRTLFPSGVNGILVAAPAPIVAIDAALLLFFAVMPTFGVQTVTVSLRPLVAPPPNLQSKEPSCCWRK